jgi:phage host-nuclease inhibitor protein Gam
MKTETEMLKEINDLKLVHERLKTEIIEHSKEIDELAEKVNNKLAKLEEEENKYVKLVTEYNNYKNNG